MRMKGLQDDITDDFEDCNESSWNPDEIKICKIKASKYHACFTEVYEDSVQMIEETGRVINVYLEQYS